MKSELLHLLAKIRTDHPDAQNIIIPVNGHGAPISVVLQHGCKRFETLEAVESYMWPGEVEKVGPAITINPS